MSKGLRTSFLAFFLFSLSFLLYLLYPPSVPLSPLALSPPSIEIETPPSDYLILGFAPYWNLKKLSPESLTSISHFAYFALHLNGDGTLYTHVSRREQDPGYTNYRRLLQNKPTNKPLLLTFMPESQEALRSLLSSPSSRTRALRTILDSLRESGASGVNIDFEPLGESTLKEREQFSVLIKDLHLELKKNNQLLTISLYASAASRPRIWDLSALSPLTDYFVVMAYDYTMPGELKTGPNSPLRGAGTLFEHDIVTNLAEITRSVPSHKILLGIPFYGYEWDTTDTSKYTPTTRRGAVASLERIDELIEENTLELLWDRNSLTPYAIRREEGEVVSQIYFENESSIKLKLDLVKQADLGGIAIWALGYEGSNPSLWETITTTLASP